MHHCAPLHARLRLCYMVQGYCLTAPAAALLAKHCLACTHVRLSDVDLTGPFFTELAGMRACTHLELAHVSNSGIFTHVELAHISNPGMYTRGVGTHMQFWHIQAAVL